MGKGTNPNPGRGLSPPQGLEAERAGEQGLELPPRPDPEEICQPGPAAGLGTDGDEVAAVTVLQPPLADVRKNSPEEHQLLLVGEDTPVNVTAPPPPTANLTSLVQLKNISKGLLLAALVIIILALIICIGVLQGFQTGTNDAPTPPPCAEGWIWYTHKCFFFSEAEGTWDKANDTCTSLQSSLAVIDSQLELDFMLRYKGNLDHWIGLKRDSNNTWKWPDGTTFNNMFKIKGVSDCAFLNHEYIRTAECVTRRNWICTKTSKY